MIKGKLIENNTCMTGKQQYARKPLISFKKEGRDHGKSIERKSNKKRKKKRVGEEKKKKGQLDCI